jgi:hypothetical protein
MGFSELLTPKTPIAHVLTRNIYVQAQRIFDLDKIHPDSHTFGNAVELHQTAGGAHPPFATQTGTTIADDENSLKAGPRGPSLLEDFHLLEKMQHFDHERIP